MKLLIFRGAAKLLTPALLAIALVGCGGGKESGPIADPGGPLMPVNEESVNTNKKLLSDPQTIAMGRKLAAQNLSDMGSSAKSALPELEKAAASDPDEDVRKVAAEAVARIKSGAAPVSGAPQ